MYDTGYVRRSLPYRVKSVRKRKTNVVYAGVWGLETYRWNYFQGSRGDADTENVPVDAAAEGERETA